MNKEFNVHPGEKVLIEVESKRRGSQTLTRNSAPSKGILPVERPYEYLARRKKKNSYINFYDLAQIVNETGAFEELNFQVIKPWSYGSTLVNQPVITASDLAATRDAQIFAVPFEMWKTHFRRIALDWTSLKSFDVFYNSDFHNLSSEDSDWNEKGLKVSAADVSDGVFGIGGSIFFENFLLNAGTNTKITSVNNYAAAASSFAPSNKMDVFLMPRPFETWGQCQLNSDSSHPNELQFLNYFHQSAPRLSQIDPDDYWFDELNQFAYPVSWFPGYDAINYYQVWEATNYFKSLAGSRMLRRVGNFGSYNWIEESADGFLPSDVFPVPTDTPTSSRANSAFVQHAGQTQRNPAGSLLAVINQNDNWFYVWKS